MLLEKVEECSSVLSLFDWKYSKNINLAKYNLNITGLYFNKYKKVIYLDDFKAEFLASSLLQSSVSSF